ncbi:hypothetical protein ES703_69941 [subsurface metagenome]|jgi:hypothetical protein
MKKYTKNNERAWENWATAKEIGIIWQLTSRRVRQIMEDMEIVSAVLVYESEPTIVYKIKRWVEQ